MDTARSWLSDSSFADATTMEGEKISCSMENALAQTIHMGRHKVRAPLGPGTVENAKHACSIINAAVRAEVMVACSDGGSRRLIVSKPCKDTFCGLHLHSYEYGTVVERVDQGGLAEAAGFDVGMQVLSVQDMDAATIEQVPVGLFCGPFPSPRDPDGTGLVVDERGVVQKIVSGGLASRWGEFKLGDQILSISNGVACGREASRRWVEGACLADYLETGKDAYLCIVKREKRASARTPLVETLMRRKHDAKPRFTTEREAAEALAHAGTYLRGYHV